MTYMNELQALVDMNPEGNGILALIVGAQLNSYQGTTQTLLDSYERQIKELKAQIECMRTMVCEAYSNPWIPQRDTVISGLFPTREEIARFLEEDPID